MLLSVRRKGRRAWFVKARFAESWAARAESSVTDSVVADGWVVDVSPSPFSRGDLDLPSHPMVSLSQAMETECSGLLLCISLSHPGYSMYFLRGNPSLRVVQSS